MLAGEFFRLETIPRPGAEFEENDIFCPDPCDDWMLSTGRVFSSPGVETRLLHCERRAPRVIELEDRRVHRFDTTAFNVELARVLGFVPSKEPWHGPEINLWLLGTRGDDPEATPLYALVEWESESVDEAVAREAAEAAMPIWGSAFPGTISCSRPRRRTG